jgi:predicted acetyltransferase
MREIRPLTAADLDAAVAIRTFAQWGKNDEAHRARFTANLARTLGSFQDGQLAAVAIMLDLETFIGGTTATIGGLAGVATAPSHRRRGHVADLLRAWFQRLHERGVGLSGESPFDPAFYARYGYETVTRNGTLELPIERFPSGSHDAVQVGPERLDELKAIHAAYARRFSLTLTRADTTRDHWRLVLAPFWRDAPYDAFLMDGAYVVIGIDDSGDGPTFPKVVVRDYAYATPAGRASVLAFLAGLAGQVVQARMHFAPGDPVRTMWSPKYTPEAFNYQMRVVDVAAALAPLRSERETRFTMRLFDAQCPWNDGLFEVELTGDGASVRRSAATVGRPGGHVEMGIGALAGLLFGATDPAAVRAVGLAEGDAQPLVDLARLLSGHPTYMAEADHY